MKRGKTVNYRTWSGTFRSEMVQQYTFQQITKPLRYLNILTGIGYFDLSEEKYTWWRAAEIVYTTVYCILIAIVSWYTFVDMKTYQVQLNLHSLGFIIGFCWNVILSILLTIAVRINIKKLHEAITLLDGSDHRMENMGMSMQRWLHYKQQIKLIATCSLIVVAFVIIRYNCQLVQTIPIHLKLTLGCAMNFPMFLILSSDVSFLFWVNYLKTKFHQLNNLLRAMLPTTADSTSEKGISKIIYDVEEKSIGKEGIRVVNGNANTMRAVNIREIQLLLIPDSCWSCRKLTCGSLDTAARILILFSPQIHLQLVKITRTINDFFGVQLLLTMCTVFVFLTVLLFFAYRTIFSGYFDDKFQSHFTQLFFTILFYLSKLFTLSHVCNRTCSEALDTGELICQLYEPSTSKEFRAEIRDFSMQMIQNPLVFTACGFFYLDQSFIHGVVGTISTYLVILIQVSQIDLPVEVAHNVTAPVTAI